MRGRHLQGMIADGDLVQAPTPLPPSGVRSAGDGDQPDHRRPGRAASGREPREAAWWPSSGWSGDRGHHGGPRRGLPHHLDLRAGASGHRVTPWPTPRQPTGGDLGPGMRRGASPRRGAGRCRGRRGAGVDPCTLPWGRREPGAAQALGSIDGPRRHQNLRPYDPHRAHRLRPPAERAGRRRAHTRRQGRVAGAADRGRFQRAGRLLPDHRRVRGVRRRQRPGRRDHPADPAARPGDPVAAERASDIITTGFEAGDIPSSVVNQLREGYAALGYGRVAVRSSATAEDLPTGSFAGQQDSFLDIGDPAVAARRRTPLLGLGLVAAGPGLPSSAGIRQRRRGRGGRRAADGQRPDAPG